MNDSWIQILTVIGSTLAIVLSFFGMTISLHNDMREEIRSNQKESNNLIRSIQEEIRDFHNRLCAIEERNKEKK